MDQQIKGLGFQFFNQPTQEMITKRRRLSEQSNGSESTGEKLLNESFKKMDLNINQSGGSVIQMIYYFQQKRLTSHTENPQSLQHMFQFPKPVRINPKLSLSDDQKIQEGANPIKSLLFEQLGIQKYLTLDCDQKLSDLLYQQQKPEPPLQKYKPQSSLFYPYGVPANFDFLIKKGEQFLKENIAKEDILIKENVEREHFIKNLDLNRPLKLDKVEREKKVQLYLEKKRNRQWKAIRYVTRKNLAEQRERVQGRFVKSEKQRFQWLSNSDIEHQSLTNSDLQKRKVQKDMRKQSEAMKNSQEFNQSL